MSKLLTLSQFQTSMNTFADKCDARFMKKGDGALFTIKQQATAESGYFATYQLFKVVDGSTGDVATGAKINIPKDYLVTAVTQTPLTVTAADKEEGGIFYENDNFAVGDKYIRFTVNVKDASSVADTYMYINLKDFVDEYTAGNGLNIVNNAFSVKIDSTNANGLAVTSDGLKLNTVVASASGVGGSNGSMTAAQAEKLAGLDNYTAGNGVDITNRVISAKIDSSNARGLSASSDGLALALATADTWGGVLATGKYVAGTTYYTTAACTTKVDTSSFVAGETDVSSYYVFAKTADGTAGALSSSDKHKLDTLVEATDQEVAAVIAAIWAS